eukprot:jgi/Chlat1/2890/Chrsp2S00357
MRSNHHLTNQYRWEGTRRVVESPILYVALGCIYALLLYLSWTPMTLRYMFASKYLLPELPGIVSMFRGSAETVASAWIHCLALDLFAARHVLLESLRLNVECRHSLVLCMLFGPLGVACHLLTRALAAAMRARKGIAEVVVAMPIPATTLPAAEL